jgi:hypothetical protein
LSHPGQGRALPAAEDIPLELIETRTFGSRVIYERYRRARDENQCDAPSTLA